jgi:hypothetical protein
VFTNLLGYDAVIAYLTGAGVTTPKIGGTPWIATPATTWGQIPIPAGQTGQFDVAPTAWHWTIA